MAIQEVKNGKRPRRRLDRKDRLVRFFGLLVMLAMAVAYIVQASQDR